MAIVKQFGPSNVSYGDAIYRSGQNQERYRRATENLGTNSAANADAKYKLGMLALEKERFAAEKPLAQKASDLAEIEKWLEKSIAYFQARAQAAQQRLVSQSQILQAGQMQVGQYPGVSASVSTQSGGGGGGLSSSASGKSISYSNTPRGPVAVPEAFSSGDRAYQGNPYLSAFSPGSATRSDSTMTLAMMNARDRQSDEMAKIDQAYQAELAQIDEVFGVSAGWQPRLFLTEDTTG
jgi:hypothetical protein